MTKRRHILGIDLGGTYTKFGLVTTTGKLIKFDQVKTPNNKTAIINSLTDIIEAHKNVISKVGLGLPGRLDSQAGKIIRTPNLPLTNISIVKIIKQKINLPVKIDNDANCFTLAEALVGSGKNYQNVVGLTIGTGVGGGIVVNKKIYRGRGNAGVLGHQFIDFKHSKDLEDFLGAKCLKLKPADYQKLEQEVQKRNRKAINFFNNLGFTLGFGIVNIIHILDPEIIILGGKQTRAFKYFYPQMMKTIKKHCSAKPPKIVKSKLIDKAGVIGATMLFK